MQIETHFPQLKLQKLESLQALWSGYGEVARYYSTALNKTVVVKHVSPPAEVVHPRGWNTPLSHQRKLTSYQVELAFYRDFNDSEHSVACRPGLIDFSSEEDSLVLILQDVDALGFPLRLSSVNATQLRACITWLADFHAQYLGVAPEGLWPIATYWHLDTRPDELASMANGPLKEAAAMIDQQLNQARFKTLVHGDAKLANFCFSEEQCFSKDRGLSKGASKVAALDFQYVGGGAGIKDVMLLMISCLDYDDLDSLSEDLLNGYFATLELRLQKLGKLIDFPALEMEWRRLFPFACADYQRFLAGWKPDHSRITSYLHAQTQKCLSLL